MKKIFVIIVLAISLCVNAQNKEGIKNGFNMEYFPEVSFVYHSNNPDKLSESNFWHLKEAGKDVDFAVSHIQDVVKTSGQHTIILWEDMAYNGDEQFKFTKETLKLFFSKLENGNDEAFEIYAFNRRKNNPTALVRVTDGFVTDKSQLMTNIDTYQRSYEHYTEFPNRSDMYTAIRESMEKLAPIQGTKSIIVFTSGYSMNNSGSDSEVQVLKKAQDLHIPVYIIQYAYRSGVAAESEGFAKSTYGAFKSYRTKVSTGIETAIKNAANDLLDLYPQIPKRYQGNDYMISFTSNAQEGDEAKMINLSVDGAEIREQLMPPPMTFGIWIKRNTLLFIVILIVVVAAIAMLISFMVKSKKKTELQQELINKQQEETKRIEEQRKKDKEEFERRERERAKKEETERLEKERQQQQDEQDRLVGLMRKKNLYPRLTCDTGVDKFVYEINKPLVTIGREEDNDLVIERPTVSRHHAEIVFNGVDFEIINKSEVNKVVVNGSFVDRVLLRCSDKIALGEVVITFYV